MLLNRPCNSTTRSKNRFTRTDLIKLAKKYKYEIPKNATINQICQDLDKIIKERQDGDEPRKIIKLPYKKIIKHDEPPEIPLKKRSFIKLPYKHQNRKECANDADLFAVLVKDIPDTDFIKIKGAGKQIYCYDIHQLVQHLITSKSNKNPYDRHPFWQTEQEFENIINRTSISIENKTTLRAIFYPKKISQQFMDAINNKYNTFEIIGIVGAILHHDHSFNFKSSLSALSFLDQTLDRAGEYKDIFLSMKSPNVTQNVGEIMAHAHETCIHGIGQNLIRIFLYYWYEYEHDQHLRKPLPFCFVQLPLLRGIAIGIRHNRNILISIYMHDENTHGLSSHISYEYIFDVITSQLNRFSMTTQNPDHVEILAYNVAEKINHIIESIKTIDAFIRQYKLENLIIIPAVRLPEIVYNVDIVNLTRDAIFEPHAIPLPHDEIRPEIPLPVDPPQELRIRYGGRYYNLTREHCQQFINHDFKYNPLTKRRLNPNSEIALRLRNSCHALGFQI